MYRGVVSCGVEVGKKVVSLIDSVTCRSKDVSETHSHSSDRRLRFVTVFLLIGLLTVRSIAKIVLP